MKIYLRSNVDANKPVFPVLIEVEVVVDSPVFGLDDPNKNVAASLDLDSLDLPSGPVISALKDKVTEQMKDDFRKFMNAVEKLCESYGLVGTYSNVSEDNSYYYNYLATDGLGNIIVDFRLKLRISNHPASRSDAQKANKNSELASERLNELLTPEQIARLKKLVVEIIVDDTKFSTYREAIQEVDTKIKRAVEAMQRNAKYRKKVPYKSQSTD